MMEWRMKFPIQVSENFKFGLKCKILSGFYVLIKKGKSIIISFMKICRFPVEVVVTFLHSKSINAAQMQFCIYYECKTKACKMRKKV